jgi:DNA replication protein DnaC
LYTYPDGQYDWSSLKNKNHRAILMADAETLREIASMPPDDQQKFLQDVAQLTVERENSAWDEHRKKEIEAETKKAMRAFESWRCKNGFWLKHEGPDVRTRGNREVLDAIVTGSGIGAELDQRSLFIHGVPQCGKSTAVWQHIARLIQNNPRRYFDPYYPPEAEDDEDDDVEDLELYANHVPRFLFTEAGELLERISLAVRTGDRKREIKKLLDHCDLIVLDDLGQSATPAQLASLLRILKAAWETDYPIRVIITANYSLEALLDHWRQHGQVAHAIYGRFESARKKGLLAVCDVSAR